MLWIEIGEILKFSKNNELYVQEMIQPHHIIINKLLTSMIKQN